MVTPPIDSNELNDEPGSEMAEQGSDEQLDDGVRNAANGLVSDPALSKIEAAWWRRAAVRHSCLNEIFDEGAPDFLAELLPFANNRRFLSLDAEMRQRVLSAGWLAYSAKTITIEKDVLLPGCVAIYDDGVPGMEDVLTKRLVSETLTDEAYHVLTTEHAMTVTRKRRGMETLRVPNCSVVLSMQRCRAAQTEQWQRHAVVVVTAIVTEVFISAHLRKMSQAAGVQPLNVWTSKLHLADELTHGKIFRSLTEQMVARIPVKELGFFLGLFSSAAAWFCDNDAHVWDAMLRELDVPGREELIADCREQPSTDTGFGQVIHLLEEAGVREAEDRLRSSLPPAMLERAEP